MNNLVQTVKATGRIGVVGVFVPEDPNAEDKLEKRGRLAFDFGAYWFKGQSIGSGQANVKAYNRLLSRLIEKDRVKPSWIEASDRPGSVARSCYDLLPPRRRLQAPIDGLSAANLASRSATAHWNIWGLRLQVIGK